MSWAEEAVLEDAVNKKATDVIDICGVETIIKKRKNNTYPMLFNVYDCGLYSKNFKQYISPVWSDDTMCTSYYSGLVKYYKNKIYWIYDNQIKVFNGFSWSVIASNVLPRIMNSSINGGNQYVASDIDIYDDKIICIGYRGSSTNGANVSWIFDLNNNTYTDISTYVDLSKSTLFWDENDGSFHTIRLLDYNDGKIKILDFYTNAAVLKYSVATLNILNGESTSLNRVSWSNANNAGGTPSQADCKMSFNSVYDIIRDSKFKCLKNNCNRKIVIKNNMYIMFGPSMVVSIANQSAENVLHPLIIRVDLKANKVDFPIDIVCSSVTYRCTNLIILKSGLGYSFKTTMGAYDYLAYVFLIPSETSIMFQKDNNVYITNPKIVYKDNTSSVIDPTGSDITDNKNGTILNNSILRIPVHIFEAIINIMFEMPMFNLYANRRYEYMANFAYSCSDEIELINLPTPDYKLKISNNTYWGYQTFPNLYKSNQYIPVDGPLLNAPDPFEAMEPTNDETMITY